MKNYLKNSALLLMIVTLLSCSSEDDSNERIDITEFIIQGEFYFNDPSLISFSNNGIATLHSFDGQTNLNYTFENNVLVIDGVGILNTQNQQIISFENQGEFFYLQYAKLAKKETENQFAGKTFSGTLNFFGSFDNQNQPTTVTCIIQFNQSGTQYNFQVDDPYVDPFYNLSLTVIGNISGYHSWSNGSDLMYFENGSLMVSKLITDYYDYYPSQYFKGTLQLQ